MVDEEVSVDGLSEGSSDDERNRLSPGRAPLSQLQMCEKFWTLPNFFNSRARFGRIQNLSV
jgi:hypothetical protein